MGANYPKFARSFVKRWLKRWRKKGRETSQPVNNKTLSRTHMESEDSRSRLTKGSGEASGGTVTKTQSHDASRLPEASKQSIAQASGESNANEAAVLKTTLKRLIEQVSSALPNRHIRLKNFVQFS